MTFYSIRLNKDLLTRQIFVRPPAFTACFTSFLVQHYLIILAFCTFPTALDISFDTLKRD